MKILEWQPQHLLFQTQRCCEQIKVNLGYMKQNVCMVGIGKWFGSW